MRSFFIVTSLLLLSTLLSVCNQSPKNNPSVLLDFSSLLIGSTANPESPQSLTSPTAPAASQQPEPVRTLIAGFLPVSAFSNNDAAAIAQAVYEPSDPASLVTMLKDHPEHLQLLSLPAGSHLMALNNPQTNDGPWVLAAFATRVAVSNIADLDPLAAQSPITWGGVVMEADPPRRAVVDNVGLEAGGQVKIGLSQLFCGSATHQPQYSCPITRTVTLALEFVDGGADDDSHSSQLEVYSDTGLMLSTITPPNALGYWGDEVSTEMTAIIERANAVAVLPGEAQAHNFDAVTFQFSRFRSSQLSVSGLLSDADPDTNDGDFAAFSYQHNFSAEDLNGCTAYAESVDGMLEGTAVKLWVRLGACS